MPLLCDITVVVAAAATAAPATGPRSMAELRRRIIWLVLMSCKLVAEFALQLVELVAVVVVVDVDGDGAGATPTGGGGAAPVGGSISHEFWSLCSDAVLLI